MEDKRELDFHIEYPAPDFGDDCLEIKNGYETTKIWPIPDYHDKNDNNSSDKEVVVVLLGWAGSQQKHLQKYSNLYLKKGCIALIISTPLPVLLFKSRKLPILANGFVRLLKDLQLEDHPIFFHVFSNGGSFMYSYILRELSAVQNNMKIDLRGTIFDSSPSPRNFYNCSKAVCNIFENLHFFRYLVATLVYLMLVGQEFWFHFMSAIKLCLVGEQLGRLDKTDRRDLAEDIPLKNWMERLCKMKNHSYLFIYSDGDDLIPYKQVEEIADITARNGNKVEKLKFIGLNMFNITENIQRNMFKR